MSMCRVYWYSHGCDLQRGHKDLHLCMAGHEPYSPFYRGLLWYNVFGEDAKRWELALTWLLKPWQNRAVKKHQKRLRKEMAKR